jgi:hypothetical protein
MENIKVFIVENSKDFFDLFNKKLYNNKWLIWIDKTGVNNV